MSLSAAIQIGRSALTASQIGMQVAGNNLANVATRGYSRQVANLIPIRGDNSLTGMTIGRGVQVSEVRRQVDSALQGRLWNGVADEASNRQQFDILSSVEATIGELTDYDLSSEMSAFFNSWSELANLTHSPSVVVQQGQRLAEYIRGQREDLQQTREQIDRQLGAAVDKAEELMSSIARLNVEISAAEGSGGGSANTLRDQRDRSVTELAGFMDVSIIDHGAEGYDVLVGSTPVVLGGRSRGLKLERETQDGEVVARVMVRESEQEITPTAGSIGGLLASRNSVVDQTIDELDTLASQLIFQVNKLHSTGSNRPGLTTTTGTRPVPTTDRALALNDPTNQTFADLPFHAVDGGFTVTVRQSGTGATQTVRIGVDLDGRDSAGNPGFTDDTSLDDLRAAIAAIPGMSQTTITADGRLRVAADAGFEFSFSDDSSGALAVLGVNSYFAGKDATDIDVRSELGATPSLVMAGRQGTGSFAENGTALRISELQSTPIDALGGKSLPDRWRDTVQAIAVDTSAADTRSRAASVVRESLEAQRAGLSGVSADEETIDLLSYQRQYQGAARLISVADQLMDQILQLV
jgi:flagellar hook-associated protein 1 FlgK